MRPVPVVLLLLAFCPHSYPRVLAAGYPQLEHVFFCLWNDTLPQRMHPVCVFVWRLPNDCVPLVCVEKVRVSEFFSRRVYSSGFYFPLLQVVQATEVRKFHAPLYLEPLKSV